MQQCEKMLTITKGHHACTVIGNPQLVLHTLTDRGSTHLVFLKNNSIVLLMDWVLHIFKLILTNPVSMLMHASIINKIFSLYDCHFHNLAHVQYLVYVRQWASKICMYMYSPFTIPKQLPKVLFCFALIYCMITSKIWL